MAAGELTGWTAEELKDLRSDFEGTPVHQSGVHFETAYCLNKIGKQPDEYDGPQRFCVNRAKKYEDDDGKEQYAPACRFHGGRKGDTADENLEKLANLSHGYYAMQEHLLEDLSDEEEEAYEEIMERGAEKGITRENDFFSWESLQSLALNIVTDRRLRKTINDEGVVRTVNEYSAQGELLDQQEEEHHLLKISQSQRRLIEKLKENLGLTRKHQDEMEAIEEGGRIEFLSEGMESALEDGEEYDPEDWEDEESG
jgi:hypothetical protein